MDRTRANLSIRLAIFGSSSDIWIPGTLVEIGLKLLLVLGSHVSMWLGPPSSQKRITALALPVTGALAAAAAARYWLSERPRKPSEPTLRKLLRQMGCCAMDPPLMILREFTRAEQRPD